MTPLCPGTCETWIHAIDSQQIATTACVALKVECSRVLYAHIECELPRANHDGSDDGRGRKTRAQHAPCTRVSSRGLRLVLCVELGVEGEIVHGTPPPSTPLAISRLCLAPRFERRFLGGEGRLRLGPLLGRLRPLRGLQIPLFLQAERRAGNQRSAATGSSLRCWQGRRKSLDPRPPPCCVPGRPLRSSTCDWGAREPARGRPPSGPGPRRSLPARGSLPRE